MRLLPRPLRRALPLLLVFGVTACGSVDISVESAAATSPTTLPDPPAVSESRQQLAALPAAPPESMAGYDREHFPHWSSHDHHCDTRELVLKRDGADVTVGDDCYPAGGRWRSAYDGEWVEDPSEVDIDHMVPLANAWRSGANAWTDAEREIFANDLERGQLIAVTAASNRAKGDQDPSQWRPDNTRVWCDYARWWIDVKHHYQLTVTGNEKQALADMLSSC